MKRMRSRNGGWLFSSVLLVLITGCVNVDYGTVAGPTELGCGGYRRVIQWSLTAPARGPGWLVQQMVMDNNWLNCDGSPHAGHASSTYWEAWPVHAAGDLAPRPNRDFWQHPNHGVSLGGWKWVGNARFYPGVALPPGMVPNNPATYAGVLPSTTVQPPWWGSRTLTREVGYEWDCCPPNNVSARVIDTHDR